MQEGQDELRERAWIGGLGTYRRIGWKHGSWHDVAWAQRTIAAGQDPPAEPR